MEHTSLLSGSVWLSLSQETRAKIAALFEIEKSGSVYVVNGANGPKVQSDGYTYEDLSVITVERMQEITGSKSTDFYHLFRNVVAIVQEEELLEEIFETTPEIMEEIGEVAVEIVKEAKKKQFCDKCDSKGSFHKKGCPNKPVKHA